MKRLVIRNLGPIAEADIELKRVNVIIGSQSSGKSCVLKTACYCTWVEKRIEITQSAKQFENEDDFIKYLELFHKLRGYVCEDTFIEYESDFMTFSYDATLKDRKFSFSWKDDRWNYIRPKVTYIPAERNMVANIPNWYDVMTNDDNIRDFMRDWETARGATDTEIDVLNLDVKYRFEPSSKRDKVVVENGMELDLTNTSSGLQSLIPLFVHLNYLDKLQYENGKKEPFSKVNENEAILKKIIEELYQDTEKAVPFPEGDNPHSRKGIVIENIGPYLISFTDVKYATECRELYNRYTKTNRSAIFLEEPEENLFPPTQDVLVDWLLNIVNGSHPSDLFVATHSPYVLTSFLERKNIDMALFFTPLSENGCKTIVKTATEADLQQIYDDGIDVFFNIESL